MGFRAHRNLWKNAETCCAVALHTQVVVNGVSLKRSFLDDFWTCMKFVTFKRSRGCFLNFEEWQMFSLYEHRMYMIAYFDFPSESGFTRHNYKKTTNVKTTSSTYPQPSCTKKIFRAFIWANYSDLTRVFTPNGGFEREIPLFQGSQTRLVKF